MPSLLQQLEPAIDFAFVEFGLSEEEFLRQTPREWQRRMRAWQQKEDRANRRTARICTVLAWCHGNSEATEDDFMPHSVDEEEEEQSFDEMVIILQAASRKRTQLHGNV